jgi:hypothetical protein
MPCLIVSQDYIPEPVVQIADGAMRMETGELRAELNRP